MDNRSLSHVIRDWLLSPVQTQIMALSIQLEGVNTTMALNADELKARIDSATNNLAGDVRGLKDKLAQALSDKEVYADQRVQEALTGFDTLADRLDALATDTPDDPVAETGGDPLDPEANTGEDASDVTGTDSTGAELTQDSPAEQAANDDELDLSSMEAQPVQDPASDTPDSNATGQG